MQQQRQLLAFLAQPGLGLGPAAQAVAEGQYGLRQILQEEALDLAKLRGIVGFQHVAFAQAVEGSGDNRHVPGGGPDNGQPEEDHQQEQQPGCTGCTRHALLALLLRHGHAFKRGLAQVGGQFVHLGREFHVEDVGVFHMRAGYARVDADNVGGRDGLRPVIEKGAVGALEGVVQFAVRIVAVQLVQSPFECGQGIDDFGMDLVGPSFVCFAGASLAQQADEHALDLLHVECQAAGVGLDAQVAGVGVGLVAVVGFVLRQRLPAEQECRGNADHHRHEEQQQELQATQQHRVQRSSCAHSPGGMLATYS